MILSVLVGLAFQTPRLQVGTEWSGVEVRHFTDGPSEIDETHTLSRSWKVVAREDRMWVVDSGIRLLGSRIDGTEIPAPAGDSPARSKEWLAPAGFLLDADPFDGPSFRIDRLLRFWLPANLPDEWTVQLSSALNHFSSKGMASFKLLSSNRTQRTYSFSFAETPLASGLSSTGKMTFDVASGRLLKADLTARRAVMPGGTDRADLKLTYRDSKTGAALDR